MESKTDKWSNSSYSQIRDHILEPLQTFADKNIKKKGPNYSIEKLHELITDPITHDNVAWINRLLNNFLREYESNDGYVSLAHNQFSKLYHQQSSMQYLESEASHVYCASP